MAQPQGHDALACLSLLLLVLLLPGAATAASYSSLCRTPAPARDLSARNRSRFQPTPIPFLDISTGHFSGGDGLHFAPDRPRIPRSISLYVRRSVATTDPALLHLSATLTLEGTHRRRRTRPHSVSFDLDGYYSTAAAASRESSELCMVGTGSYAREDGFGVVVVPDVVLRLHVPRPSNLSRPFITGSLEGAEFGAVTLVAYATGGDYEYGEAANCTRHPPLHLWHFTCDIVKELLRGSSYNLDYGSGGSKSPPLLRHRRLYFSKVYCDDGGDVEDGKLRAFVALEGNNASGARPILSNYTVPSMHPFLVGNEALVAEGSLGILDSLRGQLCLRACRVVVPSGSTTTRANVTVRDCDIGISVWFPTVWSIRDRRVVAGTIWGNASSGDNTGKTSSSGAVSVSRGPRSTDDLWYIKYNYTLVEEAKKHYLSNKNKNKPPASSKSKEGKAGRFPGGYSYRDFGFSFYGKRQEFYGYASPVTIGGALVQGNRLMADNAFYGNWTAETRKEHKLLNISYDLQYSNSSAATSHRISAEGVYDTETGSLCMVACKVNGSSEWDCEVLVTAQFAPVDATEGDDARDRVAGTIRSLRKRGDPLFFEALEFVAGGMYLPNIEETISRMDMERVVLVVSTTLSCAFTALQLLHVKRHPESLPATSLTMLVVLAAGYAVPLVLNLEAMFADAQDDGGRSGNNKHFVRLTSAGVLELNELMLRASSMLAFVLQLRLLQLALSSRRTAAEGGGGGGKQQEEAEAASSSDAERSALWVCLPLYLLGAVLVWVVHINDGGADVNYRWNNLRRSRSRALLVDDLAGYTGLVLDGFLLPQVVWNAFAGSSSAAAVPALSPWFYAGGAAVRAAPHVYDLLRRRNHVPSWAAAPSSSYVYAGPRDDLFGVAWDVAVPCGAAVLVALVFLQQRLGGAFLCGGTRRRPGQYEMVATASS